MITLAALAGAFQRIVFWDPEWFDAQYDIADLVAAYFEAVHEWRYEVDLYGAAGPRPTSPEVDNHNSVADAAHDTRRFLAIALATPFTRTIPEPLRPYFDGWN